MVLEVDYRIKGKTGAFSHCLSNNISLGGIRLLAPDEFSLGTKLDLVIKSPDNKNTCAVPGEVVWVRKSESKAGHYEAGIKFSEININQLSGLMMSITE